MKIKNRNINIDLVKCFAVFTVISVHFFRNNGFYETVILGKKMYILTLFRTLFMVCVPLFMIVTGYLMRKKELNKKYYLGIIRTLIIYVLSVILILLYEKFYLGNPFSIKYLIKSILNFEVGYSWYIEMYIGLFLIIPFINLIYNNLKTKQAKKILILTMLFLTSLPALLNIKYILIPNWWTGIYPLTYYFIGCYLNEYKININKLLNIILFLIVLLISAILNIYMSKGHLFVRSIYNDWGSIFNVMTSVLMFIFIINLKLDKLNIKIKKIIVKLSELSLGVYLSSAVVDDFLYIHYFKNLNQMSFKGYIIIIPLVFILSISISMIINFLYKLIDKYIVKRLYKPL